MSKLIHQSGDYQIRATTSGGKAGKGCNKTASLQVFHEDLIIKQVRFKRGVGGAFNAAFEKARNFIAAHETKPKRRHP